MHKCVLISNDSRSATQMRGWFRLFENQPYLEICNSVAAFEKKYSAALKQRDLLIDDSASVPEDDQDEKSKAQLLEVEAELTPIRLLIIDLDAVTSRPLDWLVSTQAKLRELGHIAEATGFKTLVLGYDDPHLRPDRFRHDAIDDMVLKPLDQQLLLQKVELLLADKPDITPSFLFRARAEDTIEIGKDTTIDEISDFAISIRNPAPLADGVFAVIHSTIFGNTITSSRMLGRCYASVRHPQYEGLWLVRFTLFGINGAQLSELRKFIRNRQMPGRNRPQAARTNSSKVKEKLPPRHRIAVIDLNRDILAQAQGCIEENFDRTAAILFPSYTRFLSGLAKLSGQAQGGAATQSEDDESAMASEGAIPGGRTTLIITEGEHELLGFEPNLSAKDSFLGKKSEDWLSRPLDWFYSVPKTDLEDFNEFLGYTATGGQGVTGVRFVDDQGLIVYAEAKGRLVPSTGPDVPATLKLEVKQIDRAAWIDLNRMVAKGATPDQYRFDALIIDGGLIRSTAAEWLDGLHGALSRARVIIPSEPLPKIFILADEEARIQPSDFNHKSIADYVYKPLDRKLFVDKLAVALPQVSRSVLPDASPFVPCELTAQVCKSIQLEELSEYGLTVLHPTPLKARSFMRFFSPLFGNISDGVLARCAASIGGTTEDPMYKCHFVFFGCSDELHKRIRTWIREDYVHKKESIG
ncbi:MAG: hypothetical protein U1E10_07285 [Bdellovibrionales bacterium]|nr:hypothetical protein [Bdellovibrionales bacterium]